MRKNILTIILLIISGCASTIESARMANTQNILIETPSAPGSECDISDKGGRKWYLAETPGTVAVKQGHPPLVVICSKKHFKKSVLTINERKEEVLTIDGKHIDVSIYNQFATKFPRLIPAVLRETAGFMQDPTGSISTEYPHSLVVWMEPKKWKSEDQMREWAFDREVRGNAESIKQMEMKVADENRKAKRRAESKEREKKFNDMVESTKMGLKRGFTNTVKILNPEPIINKALDKGVVPDTRQAIEKLERNLNPAAGIRAGAERAGAAVPVIRKGVKAMNPLPAVQEGIRIISPATAIDALNKRNEIRAEVQKKNKAEKLQQFEDTLPERNIIEIEDDTPVDLMEKPIKTPYRIYQKNKYSKDEDKIEYDENGNRIVR